VIRKFVFCLTGSLLVSLAGCVSTTSGPPKPKADDAEAAEQYYQLGARYYRAGNYELARDRLERALEFDPRMGVAHSTLALTYEELDIPRLATEHYELAVRYDAHNADVRNTYAVFLCRQREFEHAVEQFERAIRMPENDRPYIMMTNAGVCLVQKPDNAGAEAYFREALERRPNYGEALLQMTLLMRRTGELLSARAFLQRYMATNSPTASILLLAIQIERDLGNESAEAEYRAQLFEQFPESAEARRLREIG